MSASSLPKNQINNEMGGKAAAHSASVHSVGLIQRLLTRHFPSNGACGFIESPPPYYLTGHLTMKRSNMLEQKQVFLLLFLPPGARRFPPFSPCGAAVQETRSSLKSPPTQDPFRAAPPCERRSALRFSLPSHFSTRRVPVASQHVQT